MANLRNTYPDDQPQPATSDSDSPATANRKHFEQIAGHLLDSATYGGHGHAIGRQGARGHAMPANDAHKQSGQYIPQAVFDTFSDGAGCADASDAAASDYGNVDKG